MNHPQKFKTVLRITVFVIFLIYGVLGFIGASAYRNKTRRLILDNVYDTTVEIGKGIKIIYLSLRVMFI
jgi:cell division protein YceG involved in septum cleavage